MHLVYPSKFDITIVFDFSCDDGNYPGEIGNNGYMYNFFRPGRGGGGEKVQYGLSGKREFHSYEVFSRSVIWFPQRHGKN